MAAMAMVVATLEVVVVVMVVTAAGETQVVEIVAEVTIQYQCVLLR
jgi:hypothetical protein